MHSPHRWEHLSSSHSLSSSDQLDLGALDELNSSENLPDPILARDSVAGSFASTLVLTDIASGWTECIALLVREASLVVDALERLRLALPFPLRGIDTDNGSEFVNEVLLTFCRTHEIEFTRSRPYRKNDQAWVEQKNGSVVRRLVGYG